MINGTSQHPSSVTVHAFLEPKKARAVLIGDSGVGKTSIVKRILEGEFSTALTETIGVDFRIYRTHTSETGCPVKIEIWDTAGEERFFAVTSIYFRDAPLMVLCYDRTNIKSAESLRKYWLPRIVDQIDFSKVVVVLVATKEDVRIDPGAERDLRSEIEDHWLCPSGKLWDTYPRPKALHHVITSAKNGVNVEKVFQLGSDLLEQHNLLQPERLDRSRKKLPECCHIS